MAGVTGPISSMPGSYHPVPKGQICDAEFIQHLFPVSATRRIQGETDSFGSELFDCCEACHQVYKQQVEEVNLGTCDWCKTQKVKTRLTRDYDEGMSGPVYDVCASCRQKQLDDLQAELDEFNEDEDRKSVV